MGNSETQQYREKLDIKLIFMQQVTRCLQTSGDIWYGENVMSLLNLLPIQSHIKITGNQDMYYTEVETPVFTEHFGRRLGEVDDPKLRPGVTEIPRLENGDIDYNSPDVVSPKMEIMPEWDYQRLFRIILAEAEAIGILWDTESEIKVQLTRPGLEYKAEPNPELS